MGIVRIFALFVVVDIDGHVQPQQGVSEIDYCHIYLRKCDLKPLRVKIMCLNNNCMHNWFLSYLQGIGTNYKTHFYKVNVMV